MNQISPEETQRRNALLKKAKQILIQEYAAIRTKQHQQWIQDSETSWKTNGVLMAYPPGNLYPGEQEIIEKALELYNQSIAPRSTIVIQPTVLDTQAEEDIPEPLGSSPMDVTAKLQEVYNKADNIPISIPEVEPIIVIPEIVEEPIEEVPDTAETQPKHSLLRSVLSGWLSKNKDKET